jgi:hypothetical protein
VIWDGAPLIFVDEELSVPNHFPITWRVDWSPSARSAFNPELPFTTDRYREA